MIMMTAITIIIIIIVITIITIILSNHVIQLRPMELKK